MKCMKRVIFLIVILLLICNTQTKAQITWESYYDFKNNKVKDNIIVDGTDWIIERRKEIIDSVTEDMIMQWSKNDKVKLNQYITVVNYFSKQANISISKGISQGAANNAISNSANAFGKRCEFLTTYASNSDIKSDLQQSSNNTSSKVENNNASQSVSGTTSNNNSSNKNNNANNNNSNNKDSSIKIRISNRPDIRP